MKHGTESGYVLHRRAGEDACRPCKDARNAAARERRSSGTFGIRRVKARARAIVRLAAEYPERLEELIREELRRPS